MSRIDWGPGLLIHESNLLMSQQLVFDMLNKHRKLIFKGAGLDVISEDGQIMNNNWLVTVDREDPYGFWVEAGMGIDINDNLIVNPYKYKVYATEAGTHGPFYPNPYTLPIPTVSSPIITFYVQWAYRTVELGLFEATVR